MLDIICRYIILYQYIAVFIKHINEAYLKPICNEIRALIIRDRNHGIEVKEIAKQYEICSRTVIRIWKKYSNTGNFEPKPFISRKSSLTDYHITSILDFIEMKSDTTLSDIVFYLKLTIQKSQLHNILKKRGYTYKKKSFFPKAQLRDDVVKKRLEWAAEQENLDISKLVFLDESSIHCGMTPIYGWAHKSKRINEPIVDARYKRASVISTTRLNGKKATLIIEGSVDGNVFKHYVNKVLLSTIKKGDILILDNLSVHKTAGALDPIYKKGASVMFLPPYSPDFNPIEFEWSKMKSTVRSLKPQSFDDLIFAMQMALNLIPIVMIKNWYKHCGYR